MLRTKLKGAEIGEAIACLAVAVAQRAGLGEAYFMDRRLAAVERLRRDIDADQRRLFSVELVRTELDSTEPARMLVIRRVAASLSVPYRLVVEARCLGLLASNNLLELRAGISEVRCDAGTHVTDADLAAFNDAGALVEKISVSFIQTVGGNLIAHTGNDLLPAISGAVCSPDLQQRTRLSTSSIPPISAGNRAGGIDVLWATARLLDQVAGPRDWSGAVRWFENSSNNQADVIRCVKQLLEDPQTVRAVLADPYLGKDAFERVILRQGRQDLELTILVSPNDVDPDAATLDVKGTAGAHLSKLRQSLERFADRTCGNLRLVNLRRGEGSRQAFHDRYLLLWGRDEVPRAFLLSNSLNEAAGTWPYALAELDRASSWSVASYLSELLAGRDGDRSLVADEIWPVAPSDRSVLASVEGHCEILTWLAGDLAPCSAEAADEPSGDKSKLQDWVRSQPWVNAASDPEAHQAYGELVARRWLASSLASAQDIAHKLFRLAVFEAATGHSSMSKLGPLLGETDTAAVVSRTLAKLAAAEPDTWDDLRDEADVFFTPGPLKPAICAAALRVHGRFGWPSAAVLLGLLLQLDPLAVDEALTNSNVPPRLRLIAISVAMHICLIGQHPDLADRLSASHSPALRMLSLLTFDQKLQGWVPREASAERASGVEAITVRAADITASLVRASPAMMQNIARDEVGAEKSRRDAAHASAIDNLASHWPGELEQSEAAKLAWSAIWERFDTSERLGTSLRRHGHDAAANHLDQIAASEVLARLLPEKGQSSLFLPNSLQIRSCSDALRLTGRTLAASAARPTDFVRTTLNPAMANWLNALDTDILGGRDAMAAVLASLAISIVALQISLSAMSANPQHRLGLSVDYVWMVARVLRSEISSSLVGRTGDLDGGLLDQVAQVLSEVRASNDIESALAQVSCDPDIPDKLKMRLGLTSN